MVTQNFDLRNRETGNLRRHRTRYDVTVTSFEQAVEQALELLAIWVAIALLWRLCDESSLNKVSLCVNFCDR